MNDQVLSSDHVVRDAGGGEAPMRPPLRAARSGPLLGKRPIAVIGAGFSGTIAALQLLRRLPVDQPVLLCERSPDFARGVAYATGDHDHLLNVRAANMSALSDDPLHFQDWVRHRQAQGDAAQGLHETEAGIFASRGLYGQYLRSILDHAMRATAGHAQLRLLPDEVLDIVPADDGEYDLVCAGGLRLGVAGIVLAVGNLPPEESDDPRICRNPWSAKARLPLLPDQPIFIVGTGLTMVDIVLSWRRRGFTGGIVALSRGGMLPQRHAHTSPWPTPVLGADETGSIRALTARLRREIASAAAQGWDWRAVIDSLRPITARLWGALDAAQRRRFLRHARRYWDVHRHRMAPPNADLIEAMQREGTLRVVAGRVRAIESSEGSVRVRYAPRQAGGAELAIDVQRVIMASGLEHMARTRDPLMQRLIDRGLIRIDHQGLGIDVTDSLHVVQGDGSVAARVWALGPIVRGMFWECVAVPDIRVQAAAVAESVEARLHADAPQWSYNI